MNIVKWIGAFFGMTRFGFIGGIVGFILGSIVDEIFSKKSKANPNARFRPNQRNVDFATSFLTLSAVVMKADGKLLKSELDVIRTFFVRNFGEQQTVDYMVKLKTLLDQEIDLGPVCSEIRYSMQHPMRLQLLKYLFEIAKADGVVNKTEINAIFEISKRIGVSYRDFEAIQAMYFRSQNTNYNNQRNANSNRSQNGRDSYTYDPYKILGIEKTATDIEVKKAYRAMARKHHPDAVSSLGEAHVAKAQEKFIIIDEAYQYIKERRGIK